MSDKIKSLPLALGDNPEVSSLTIRVRDGVPVLSVTSRRCTPLANAYRVEHRLTDGDLLDLHEWITGRLRATNRLVDAKYAPIEGGDA